MDDGHLEHLLRQMRPVGPPPSLRARVLARPAAPRPRSLWIWLPAAAAMLVMALAHWRTERIYDAVAQPQLAMADAERQAEVDRLSRAWGDSEAARAAAAATLASFDAASHSPSHSVSPEGSIR